MTSTKGYTNFHRYWNAVQSVRYPNALLYYVFLLSLIIPMGGCGIRKRGAGTIQETSDAPILPAKERPELDLRAESACSAVKPGVAQVSVSWRHGHVALKNQRLDLTIFKNGFEQNLYSSLWPLQENSAFRAPRAGKLTGRPSDQALYPKVTGIHREKNRVTVKLEGLETGLLYFWRVLVLGREGWTPHGATRLQGRFCPGLEAEKN